MLVGLPGGLAAFIYVSRAQRRLGAGQGGGCRSVGWRRHGELDSHGRGAAVDVTNHDIRAIAVGRLRGRRLTGHPVSVEECLHVQGLP